MVMFHLVLIVVLIVISALYSDNDSSSGYMTGKSNQSNYPRASSNQMLDNYQTLPPAPLPPGSPLGTSVNTSMTSHSQGAYLNLPFPPRGHAQGSGVQPMPSTAPPNLVDNREHRGSAFELYKRNSNMSANLNGMGNYSHYGLPPPPPPPLEEEDK